LRRPTYRVRRRLASRDSAICGESSASDLGLEAADLLRDRRLGAVELIGRLGERAVAGNRADGAQCLNSMSNMVLGGSQSQRRVRDRIDHIS
jgi:hypothetical protein